MTQFSRQSWGLYFYAQKKAEAYITPVRKPRIGTRKRPSHIMALHLHSMCVHRIFANDCYLYIFHLDFLKFSVCDYIIPPEPLFVKRKYTISTKNLSAILKKFRTCLSRATSRPGASASVREMARCRPLPDFPPAGASVRPFSASAE